MPITSGVTNKVAPGRRKIFYGWWMVLAGAILNFFGGGVFSYGFTVFFNPIRQTFGWSATVTSVAFSLRTLEFGIAGPAVGFLVDRLGPRRLMLFGWSTVGCGFLLASRISSLWTFYGTFVLIAIGMSFGVSMIVQASIANWFSKKRSRAMALVLVGNSAGGILVPILAWLISEFDWRQSLFMVGITSWIIGMPLSLLMRHKPGQYGYLPDGEAAATTMEEAKISKFSSSVAIQASPSQATDFTTKTALKTRTFWLMATAFFFQHAGTSAVMVHIVPYLESVNIPRTIAASVVTGVTLWSLIGRLGFGFLGDFKNKRYLIAIALSLQALGLLIFSFVEMNRAWLIILFLLTFASSHGAPMPLRAALQADYFGTKNFGTIMGLMAAVIHVGALTSPVFAGWVFDVTGSYRLAWQLFALVTLPAIPFILMAKTPKVK